MVSFSEADINKSYDIQDITPIHILNVASNSNDLVT